MKYLFCLLAFCFCAPSYAQRWSAVDLGEGLSVDMPGEPKVQQVDKERTSYGSVAGNCSFSVLKSRVAKERLPSGSAEEQKTLALALGVERARQNDLLLSERSFTTGTISGLEVVKLSSAPGQPTMRQTVTRAFFRNGVLYQLTCLYYQEGDTACDQLRDRFFGSLVSR